jgi:glycosyltransferase involved in cell wall biosynthesis
MTVPEPAVVIAMLTFRRPDDLRAAIPALLDQIRVADVDAMVLVVDNDPDGGAMSMAPELSEPHLRFVHEPSPGIAAARNRALIESTGSDVLIFIDDDERPEPGWLSNLLATWKDTGAAAVVGPVVSSFEEKPDDYITAGGFFIRRRMPTGTAIDVAATNNLLLDLAQLERADIRFDERFSASGGSDTLFTRELHRRGGRMVWCDEAIVVDVVPPNRSTRSWVLRRALRTGNSWSRTSVALESAPWPRLLRRLELTAQGVARVLGGGVRLAFGAVTRSVGHRARGARTVARGLGMTTGAWGLTYVEYRRRDRG